MGSSNADQWKALGERIRQIRESKGWTQEDLSEKSGVSLPRISTIELGKTEMKLSTFIRITEALQISADSLLRLDTDQGRQEYAAELSKVLEGCKPYEMEAIIEVAQAVTAAIRKGNSE